jgi:hypothetical protein
MAYVRRQAAEWATLIDEWRRSGLSLPTFCQLHGLSRGTMQNWVYKPALKLAIEESRRQAQLAPSDPGLVDVAEVTVASPPTQRTGVEVVLGSGRRISLEAGFDSETLRRVVAVLEGRPC